MNKFEKIYEKAQTCFTDGKYVEAETLYRKLLDLKPEGCANIHNKIGFIRHQAGDFKQSIPSFKKALELNPHYTEAALNLTIAYNDTEQYAEAEHIFSRAADVTHRQEGKRDPFLQGKLANEHFKLGNTYFEMGSLDDAEEQYRKALSIRPDFVDVMTRLGITLREKGLFSEAVETFRMAIKVKEDFCPAMIHLGITYYMNGFTDLALREWEIVEKMDPNGSDAKVYLSLARKKVINGGENPLEKELGETLYRDL